MRKLFVTLLSIFIFFACKKPNDVEPVPPPPIPAPKVPVLLTNPITDLTLFSVTLGGKIIDTGGSRLTETGIVVDTFPTPTITKNLNKFICQPDSNGFFSSIIIEVPSNKNWYVRAYAKNAQGTGYGNEVQFTSLQEKIFFGDVRLTNQQEVDEFGANQYTTIKGSMYISGPVTTLNALNSLVIVGNKFSVRNTELADFRGLEKLEMTGIDFGNGFEIVNNPKLTSCLGLKNLKLTNGTTYFSNNDALVNFTGLDNFRITGNFEFAVRACDNLTSLEGLDNLQIVLGTLTIGNNPSLIDISALHNLETVTSKIFIVDNPLLQNLNGFEKVRKVEFLELVNNPMLTDISGLANLDTITENLHIDNNDALTDLSAFNNIVRVGGISIMNNAAIKNFEGFKDLQHIDGALSVEHNPALTSFFGLNRLKAVLNVEVLYNSSLQSLNGLDSVTSLAHLLVVGNGKLRNLDGLKGLRSVKSEIQILNNAVLDNFCGLKPLFVAGYQPFFRNELNKTNPTKEQIISECP